MQRSWHRRRCTPSTPVIPSSPVPQAPFTNVRPPGIPQEMQVGSLGFHFVGRDNGMLVWDGFRMLWGCRGEDLNWICYDLLIFMNQIWLARRRCAQQLLETLREQCESAGLRKRSCTLQNAVACRVGRWVSYEFPILYFLPIPGQVATTACTSSSSKNRKRPTKPLVGPADLQSRAHSPWMTARTSAPLEARNKWACKPARRNLPSGDVLKPRHL